MRSDTAFFSAADIFRRFLSGLLSSGLASGLASGSLSVTAAAAFLAEEDRRAPGPRRRRGGFEEPFDVAQRLDLRLKAVDFALPVGNCLCYVAHRNRE